MSATSSPELALMELAADCEHDPLGFAKGFWPDRTLRKWQEEILSHITEDCQSEHATS
jgi:hypothetical protein